MSSLHPVSGNADEIEDLLRAWDMADDPAPLVIETSGSTGRPKRVMLSRAALRASVDATHARLGGPGRWELNLPPTYVAGVQVLYRNLRAGPDATRRYLSLVPTQLVRELRDDVGDGAALADYDAVLVGGGPLDPVVRAEAESRGVRIVQTYGMSETCGGCVYDGVPLDGVEVRISDGQVQLRGPMIFEGYEGDPERTAAAFDEGWLRTDDLGSYDGGVLRIDGRADDVIISGGVKVPAQAVTAMVLAHPAAVSALVVGVPEAEWGEEVVAVIEARDPISLESVRSLVEPRAWAPRRIVLTAHLPLLANGKPDRIAIRELAR